MRLARREPISNTLPQRDTRLVLRVFLPLVLVAIAFGLYHNAINNPFVIDDIPGILLNPNVTQPRGLTQLWTQDVWAGHGDAATLYRPITVLSYHLNARLGNLNPTTFRVVNIAMLGIAGWFGALWMSRYVRRTAAWLAAAMFVAHPLHAESINHIIGRADLLSLIGVLGVLYLQKRAIEKGKWDWLRAIETLLFAVIAVGSKETGIVLLPLVLAQAWFNRHATVGPAPMTPPRTAVLGAVVLLVPLGAFLVVRLILGGLPAVNKAASIFSLNPLTGMPITQRWPAAMATAWQYFRQLFWPEMTYNHIPPFPPTLAHQDALLGIVVVITLLVVLVILWKERSWLVLALILVLSHLAIVCNYFVPTRAYMTHRFAAPLVLAAVCFIAAWIDRFIRSSSRRRAAAVLPCAILMAAMGWMIYHANLAWASEITRFETDLAYQPNNPVATYNFGRALTRSDDEEQTGRGIVMLEDLVKRQPQMTQARMALGRAYQKLGETTEAANQFRVIIDQFPNDWRARLAIVDDDIHQGNLEEASLQLHAAQLTAPLEIEVCLRAASLARAEGRPTEALAIYQGILLRSPNHEAARQGYEEIKGQNIDGIR